jgi:hypothetical protein
MKLLIILSIIALNSCNTNNVEVIKTDCGYSVVTQDKAWDCLTEAEKDKLMLNIKL